MPLENQQQQQVQGKEDEDKDKAPIFHVTSAGLAPETRRNYERDINHFLNHFKIKDVEPFKDYSLQFWH